MLRRLNRIIESLSAHIALYLTLGVGGAMSLILAWAARTTEQLKPYAPLSWVLSALLGVAFVAAIVWLGAKARDLWASARIKAVFHDVKGHNVNPLEATFQKERITILDFVAPFDRTVADKTFIDCDILGPANIALEATGPGGGTMNSCQFYECRGAVAKNTIHLPFGVLFRNCTFIRCRLYGLILFIPEGAYSYYASTLPGLLWITPEPTIPITLPAAPPLSPAQLG